MEMQECGGLSFQLAVDPLQECKQGLGHDNVVEGDGKAVSRRGECLSDALQPSWKEDVPLLRTLMLFASK